MQSLKGSGPILLVLLVASACNVQKDKALVARSHAKNEATWGPRVGKQAPEIEGPDLEGNLTRLSDQRGKVVLLSFWAHF